MCTTVLIIRPLSSCFVILYPHHLQNLLCVAIDFVIMKRYLDVLCSKYRFQKVY
jgi:hypothetical protein